MQLLPDFINTYVKTCSLVEEVITKKLYFFYDLLGDSSNQNNDK